MNTSIIRNAIANKQLVEFIYKGHIRVAEPHIYGIKNEKRQLLVYQVGGGTSSGGIPDWRRIELNEISNLKVTEDRFKPRLERNDGDRANWDVVIAVAE